MPGDATAGGRLFAVLVDAVIDRDEEVRAVGELAAGVDARALVRGVETGEDLVRAVLAEGIRVSLRRFPEQQALAVRLVREEMAAYATTDARALGRIDDVAIAARRAERLQATAAEEESGT